MSPPPKFVGFGLTVPGMAVKGPSCTMTESTYGGHLKAAQLSMQATKGGLMRRRWLPEIFVLVVLEDTSSDNATSHWGGCTTPQAPRTHQVQITHLSAGVSSRAPVSVARSTQRACRLVKRRAEEPVEISPQRSPSAGLFLPRRKRV